MGRRGLWSLVGIVLLAVGGLVYTFVAGNSPLLGLDLQGGVSVVLQPVGDASDDQIDQAIEIIRQRVDGLGVAEPEISRQGDNVLVQIPGVKDQERALELVGQTAELRFRPVLASTPEAALEELQAGDPSAPSTTVPGGSTTPGDTTPPGETVPGDTTPPGETVPGDTTATTTAPGEGETGLGSGAAGELAQGEAPPSTEAPATDTGETVPADAIPPEVVPPDAVPPGAAATGLEITPPEDDRADEVVVLPGEGPDGEPYLYQLGPAQLSGEALSGASASLSQTGQWVVLPTFRGGGEGIDAFNALAAQCFPPDPTVCPTGQVAITLDGRVISAPQVQQASFEREGIEITGNFEESSARDLALVLQYGALPVELEPQQVQVVSATLGEDALRAGVIAGAVGLLLASLYMIAFYRLLGVVAIVSLAISGAFLWTLIAYLGESQGLALTLAGITGIVVSIGISLDSNVVYFENLKEDYREGRTLRSAVDRSWGTAFSTIVKADVASLIGAGLLYWLTVGPVRGFALYLGLATLLDLVASYFFMRPAVARVARWKGMQDHPGRLALSAPRTEDDQPAPVGVG